MQQNVTLESVQKTMKHLQDLGERVSRRNVRAITGGGMSTVHRLMSVVEEQEALQDGLFANGISETFLAALKNEIAQQLKSTTENYQTQIRKLKTREQEIIEALAAVEEKNADIDRELIQLKETSSREQHEAEKAQAVAQESIRRLENWIEDYKTERKELSAALEAARAENISSKRRIENLEKDLKRQLQN